MAPTTAGRSCSFYVFGLRSATQERFAFGGRKRRLSGKREASMRSPLHRDRVGRGPGPEAGAGPPLLGDPLLYAVALIASAVCAPVFRYVLWLGDEGVLLHGAARILGGEVLYRDFFEVLPPGSFLIITAWMKLFGAGFASVRVLAVGVIAVIAALLYATARLSSDNRPLAALLSIAWAVRVPWENSHHWFTTAASMAAAVGLLLALDGAPRRGAAFLAGLFAGAAAIVTPMRGALLCLAVVALLFTLPGARSRLLSAIVGIGLVPAAMILYLTAIGTLGAAVDDVLRFPARRYVRIQAVPFGSFATLADTASVALFPITLVLAGTAFALRRAAIWRELRFRASLALAGVGLVGAYPRPDIAHLNFTAPLACPLFALVATDLLGRLGRRARIAAGALLIGLCLAHVGYALKLRMAVVTAPLHEVPTARGLTVRLPSLWTDDFAALVVQIDRIPRDDAFFFYPYVPMLPYLTARRHVAALDVMTPGYTTTEQFRETCVRVLSEARWVVIERSWTDPAKLRSVFPAMRDPDPPEQRGFQAALRLAFDRVVHTSTFFELRARDASASVALCDRIGASPDTR